MDCHQRAKLSIFLIVFHERTTVSSVSVIIIIYYVRAKGPRDEYKNTWYLIINS